MLFFLLSIRLLMLVPYVRLHQSLDVAQKKTYQQMHFICFIWFDSIVSAYSLDFCHQIHNYQSVVLIWYLDIFRRAFPFKPFRWSGINVRLNILTQKWRERNIGKIRYHESNAWRSKWWLKTIDCLQNYPSPWRYSLHWWDFIKIGKIFLCSILWWKSAVKYPSYKYPRLYLIRTQKQPK